jgi:hypothetical protein
LSVFAHGQRSAKTTPLVCLLLAMDQRDAEPYRLTAEERAEIDAALSEVERGEVASPQEVTAVFKRFGHERPLYSAYSARSGPID